MSSPSARVQLVISGKFIVLLLAAVFLFAGGYYWYSQQQEVHARIEQEQARFKTPPYFVNRGPSVFRNCQHCLDTSGKLKPQSAWKVWGPQEIPPSQHRWFLAVEEPPLPVTVAGVLMLPLHPAVQEDPSFGFDQSQVVLVLYQNLQRMSRIEKLPPPSTPPAIDPPKPSPVEEQATEPPRAETTSPAPEPAVVLPELPYVGEWRNVDPFTKSLTRLQIRGGYTTLTVHAWAKCPPVECDWGESTVPLAPLERGLYIVWDHHYAFHKQDIKLQDDGRLKVSLTTQFKDQSGRRDIEIISYFRKVEP